VQIRLIRNATLLLDYAGHHIMIDPYFADRHALPSFTGRSRNPMVDLPVSPEAILAGVELVLVSHLHTDHFDKAAQLLIPKNWPLLCQPGDKRTIRRQGFEQVTVLKDALDWHNLRVTRTAGHHGTGEVEGLMGRVSGFVFEAPGEPSLYWAGDTILCEEVEAAIARFEPGVMITHSCGAAWPDAAGQRSLIVMDAAQTIAVCQLMAGRPVIATHMEALDHATVSRAELRQQAAQAGISERALHIPADGETLSLP